MVAVCSCLFLLLCLHPLLSNSYHTSFCPSSYPYPLPIIRIPTLPGQGLADPEYGVHTPHHRPPSPKRCTRESGLHHTTHPEALAALHHTVAHIASRGVLPIIPSYCPGDLVFHLSSFLLDASSVHYFVLFYSILLHRSPSFLEHPYSALPRLVKNGNTALCLSHDGYCLISGISRSLLVPEGIITATGQHLIATGGCCKYLAIRHEAVLFTRRTLDLASNHHIGFLVLAYDLHAVDR